MIGFDQYVQKRVEEALKTEYYNPAGNSGLATYNKPFLKCFICNAKCLYRNVKTVAEQPALESSLGDLLSLVIIIPLFPIFALLRTFYSKKRAKNELMSEWEKV